MLQKWEVVKRWLIFVFFFGVAAWLVWCVDNHNRQNFDILPAVMCGLESILLMMIGAAIMRGGAESEFDE
jgi:hypothetical protein